MTEATKSSSKTRVLIVTEDDPLYVIRFFNVFFDEFPRDEFEIVGVTVQEAFHEPITKTAKRMLRFYGPIDFVRLGTRFAFTKLRGVSIAKLAESHGLPLVPTTSVNDDGYIKRVGELAPDIIVSVAAPEIFRKGILGAARLRCINIHSGRLPKYRGMMPNFWQLLHQESHATVTVHEMAEKLDAGAVIDTLDVPIRSRDSLHRMICVTKEEGARLMIECIRAIASGTDSPTPLDMTQKQYFSFPKPEDVKKLRATGHRML